MPDESSEDEIVLLVEAELRRGRGARSNRVGRFESELRETFDDGWESLAELSPFKTDVHREMAKSIISTNDSPDISFEQSINPYRGCEHGCIYCFARPTHCYLGHSAGLDFETKLYAKVNAAELLERELANPRYVPKYIALGAVTDPYQPIEREHRITRAVLEVLDRTSHPVGIVTKSALVMRDLDILARMASRGLVKVAISVTTLDRRIARKMEPRAATPPEAPRSHQGAERAPACPVAVMVAPIIPAINDSEIERILAAAAMPVRPRPATCCCACRWSSRSCSASGCRPSCRSARRAPSTFCAPCTAARTTRRNGACGSAARVPTPSRSAPDSAWRQALRPQRAQLEAAHRPVPAPGRQRRPALPALTAADDPAKLPR